MWICNVIRRKGSEWARESEWVNKFLSEISVQKEWKRNDYYYKKKLVHTSVVTAMPFAAADDDTQSAVDEVKTENSTYTSLLDDEWSHNTSQQVWHSCSFNYNTDLIAHQHYPLGLIDRVLT